MLTFLQNFWYASRKLEIDAQKIDKEAHFVKHFSALASLFQMMTEEQD